MKHTIDGDVFPPADHILLSEDDNDAITACFDETSVLLTCWYNRVDYDGNRTGLWTISYDAGVVLSKRELSRLIEISSDKMNAK